MSATIMSLLKDMGTNYINNSRRLYRTFENINTIIYESGLLLTMALTPDYR